MTSTVYFLPWSKLDKFSDWLDSVGTTDHIRENELVALKIHFGEKGNLGYIKPQYAKITSDKIKKKNASPFLTDTSTIYAGKRVNAVSHTLLAAEHGFTLNKCACPIIIADGLRGNAAANVEVNLKHFKNVQIANAIHYADSFIFLSHFKGHELSGFGGALKNIGMGCGTRGGKIAMHNSVRPKMHVEKCTACGECAKWCGVKALEVRDKKIHLDTNVCVGCGECTLRCAFGVFEIPWDESVSSFQEKMVEYAYGVLKSKRAFYVNFINYVTKLCDCYKTVEPPLLDNIGVMAGADPVALDQACADLVNKAYGGKDFWRFIYPHIDSSVQLQYAEKLGLGSRKYEVKEY
ncbi:MAG: DUF362 domain-containing protein [Elusimicrobiota bacterium]